MAQWKPTRYMKKFVHQSFGGGENNGVPPFDIGDNQVSYSRNMDSREYPAITVRPPRSTYAIDLSTSGVSLGQRNNQFLHVANGNTWKYWNPATTAYIELTTTLTTALGEFGEFVDGANRYTIFMNSTQKLIWDGTSTVLVLGDANTPFTDKFTVHKGRIYALDGASVDYSALNKTTDWTTANDAGSISITQAQGNGTAIIEYNDYVVSFTEFSMHEQHGSGPSNFELKDIEGDIGCISNKSLVKCNRRLYWLWFDGVYEFDGSSPVKVSQAVDDYIKDINLDHKTKCVAGATGDFYYLSIVYGSSATQNNLLLKYNTRLKVWHVETGSFTDFITIGNNLYGVDTGGKIWNMRNLSATEGLDSATPISWEFVTKPFNDNAIGEKKIVDEMYVVTEIPTGSTSFSMGYSTNVENNDSTSFTSLTTISASSNIQDTYINVPISSLQNVNWYRLRFAGTGKATVHKLQKNVRVKRR